MAERIIGLQVKIIGTQEQVRELGKIEQGLKKLGLQRKQLLDADKTANKQLQQNEKTLQRINQLEKSNQITKKEAVKQRQELNRLENQATDTLRKNSSAIGINRDATIQLQNSKRKLEQTIRSKVRADQSNIKTMEGVRGKLSKLKNEIEKIDTTTRSGKKRFNELATEIRNSETKIRDFNAQLGRGRTFVGEYARGAVSAFKQVAQAAGVAFGIAGVVRFGREAITVGATFQQSVANLGAISRATAEDLKKLEEEAKRVGETSIFTASQVAELETNLAKLGFTPEQILASTEAITELAAATGEDLGEAALVAANTVRGFGLEAEETQRVVDVMTLSFSKSALDLSKFSTAMAQVAPVAKTFGFSVEQTTGLLAQLTNAGFDASRSGTALRNILLNLANENGKLANALGGSVDNADDLLNGLIQLRDGGIDLNETLELTDKRSVAAFNQFLDTAEAAKELTSELENAGGASGIAAAKQLDTLQGAAKLLLSAFQGLIIDGFQAIEPELRAIVQGALTLVEVIRENATLISNLVRGLTVAGIALATYNTLTRASAALTTAWGTATAIATGEFSVFTIGVKIGTVAMRIFNAVSKLNPFVLLATLAATATAAFFAFRDSAEEATEAQENLNKSVREFEKHVRGLDEVLGVIQTGGDKSKLSVEELEQSLAELDKQIQNFDGDTPLFFGGDTPTKDQLAEAKKANSAQLEELKKASRQIEAELQRRKDSAKTVLEQSLEDQRNNIQARLETVRKGTQEEINLKTQLANIERDIALQQIGLTESEKFKIREKAKGKIIDLEKQTNELIFNESKLALQRQIEFLEDGSQQQVDKQVELLELEFEAKLATIERGGEQEKLLRQRLKQEISDVEFEAEVTRREKELEALSTGLTERLNLLEIERLEGTKTLREYEDEKLAIRKEALEKTRDILTTELNALQAQVQGAISSADGEDIGLSTIFTPEELEQMGERIGELELLLSNLGVKLAQLKVDEETGQPNTLQNFLGLDEEGMEKFQAGLDIVFASLDAFGAITSAISQRRMQELEEERKATIGRFDQQIKSAEKEGKSTRALLKQKAKAEEDFEAKKEELRKEAAQKEKASKIISATINTALGVVNALATAPNIIAGIVLAALVAATGAAQIATIAAQKVRKGGIIEKGARGLIASGGSHEQGGIKLYDTNTGTFTGQEIEGGEPVLTRGVARDPNLLAQASAINEAAGGRSLVRNRAGTVLPRSMQGGGVVGRAPASGANLESAIAQLDERSAQRVNNIKVTNVATDTEDVALGVNNLESEFTFID